MNTQPAPLSVQPLPACAPARRVLIVEDEPVVSLFLQHVLQDLGYEVSGIAPSLRTALAVVAGVRADMAIVDVGLAGDGGDGIDAAIALRERFGIPSVLMTGASLDGLALRVERAQPMGLLRKPYTLPDVERTLNSAFAQRADAYRA